MKSGLLSIIQKELKRFFTDRRLVLTTIVLPGLLIYLLYSFMGNAMTSNLTVSSDYEQKNYAVNLPDSLVAACEAADLEFISINSDEINRVKEDITDKTADLLAVFPANFDEETGALLEGAPSGESPDVELFYNSTRVESGTAFGQIQSILTAYKESLQPVFTINAVQTQQDLASEEDTAGFMFASLLPMLLMIFLYSGCYSVAPESIAGEKERGTIATLLVTPLKRWELALGKIVSLCLIALLSGASSFIGVMLSLPSLLRLDNAGEGSSALLNSSVYGMQDYLMLLVVILSTVVLFVGLISVISAFARNTKEANTMVMPLMMIVLLVAATAMFQTSSETNLMMYLLPVYNSVQSMVSVFGFTADPAAIGLTAGVNLVISAICVVVLTRMFESERVVFSK